MVPAPIDPRIQKLLKRVFGPGAARAKVTPLSGGITNRNFKVDVPDGAFVLRVGGEGTDLLGIDRRHEHAASAAAAGLGIGAEVVAFLEDEKALVTRFIEGSSMSPEAAAKPATLRRIVESIRVCHGGPEFPASFSAFDTVRDYHKLARKHGVKFPRSTSRVFEAMERIEDALGRPERPAPCHNDLLAGNFIDDGRVIRILDWEYAGMGDPFFDLGNFAVNQSLAAPALDRLLKAYFGRVRARDLARLRLMMLASDLREAFWGFLQSGVSKLEFDFTKYALDHIDRFLKNVAHPDLEEWIQEAKGK